MVEDVGLVPDSGGAEARAADLNRSCGPEGALDAAALLRTLQAQGADWSRLVAERCPHLFAGAPLFVAAVQLRQMQAIIEAIERVVALPGWGEPADGGVFFGYDFHLNAEGAHLIEINTNAGGAFLNALLIDSQRGAGLPGVEAALPELESHFLDMFRREARRGLGDRLLQTVAILDEQPQAQYLYPEFLLAQRMFERAGIEALIADPAALAWHDEGLYCQGRRIDLVYNRLTDFALERYPTLLHAFRQQAVVVTPNPMHYLRYADKRNLARLCDAARLRELGTDEADIAVLQVGVPETVAVTPEGADRLWAERRQWFFKPNTGYGSKGAYRGEKLTRRVFGEILQADYVAQRLAVPGERTVCLEDGEGMALKYDVRCYVYEGRLQLVAARLYQGQTTNFRTPGGGFAPVRVLG